MRNRLKVAQTHTTSFTNGDRYRVQFPLSLFFPPSGRCRCCYIIIISLSAIIVVLFSFCTILLFLSVPAFYCCFRGGCRAIMAAIRQAVTRKLNAQVNGASLIPLNLYAPLAYFL